MTVTGSQPKMRCFLFISASVRPGGGEGRLRASFRYICTFVSRAVCSSISIVRQWSVIICNCFLFMWKTHFLSLTSLRRSMALTQSGRFWPAFLTGGAATRNSRAGEVSEGRGALRTAGLETGATHFRFRSAPPERQVEWVSRSLFSCGPSGT